MSAVDAPPSPPSSPTRRARGGRGGAEPRARIRDREARVVELSTRGWTQRAIAADVGVSQAAVSKIVRRVDDRLLATLHQERIRLLVRLARRREHVYAQAQAGWERSGTERQRRVQRRTTTPDGRTYTTVAVHSEAQAGDPRFLTTMLRVVAETGTAFRLGDVDWVAIAAAREADLARAAAARNGDTPTPPPPGRPPRAPAGDVP